MNPLVIVAALVAGAFLRMALKTAFGGESNKNLTNGELFWPDADKEGR